MKSPIRLLMKCSHIAEWEGLQRVYLSLISLPENVPGGDFSNSSFDTAQRSFELEIKDKNMMDQICVGKLIEVTLTPYVG